MLKFITNIQISRRLLFAFLLAAFVPGIVISILGVSFLGAQTNRSQAVQTNISAFKSTSTTGTYLPKMKEMLNTAYQQQYESDQPTVNAKAKLTMVGLRSIMNTFESSIRDYQREYQIDSSPKMSAARSILLTNDPESTLPARQTETLNQVQNALWPGYDKAIDQVVDAINNKADADQVRALIGTANDKYTPLNQAWTTISQIAEDINTKVAEIGPAQTNTLLLGTIIAFLTTFSVVTTIGYVVYRTITRPLHHLAQLTKRIARGETNARATISGRDEIYLVATSMNNMLDNIVRLIQEAQNQRDLLQNQVEKLVSEVSGVGEGDLRVQAEVTADALGVLADSFNYMVDELGSLVVRVKMVSNEVDTSTSTILDRMTQLVDTGNRQIDQIGQAAHEVEQMTSSSRQVAERSQVLYDVARVARQDAQLGRESVEQAVEGMGRINENVHQTASKVQTLGERSREIDEIVEAISSIAHQTNRLALDAAIQAAMAGENGKGFGAVAADIRRLAERAKDQAGLITRIVRGVREDIAAVAISMQDTERETDAGARLTQEAGVALESIFAAVEHQAREIENINQVATQQLQSSNTVVQIMHGVSDSTQQSSQSTREASQNMERLARLVEQLRASVEAFKLRENHSYQVPNTGANINLDDDTPLTVSGVFRTVSASLGQARQATGSFLPVSETQNTYTTPVLHNQVQTRENSSPDWRNIPQSEEAWTASKPPVNNSGASW